MFVVRNHSIQLSVINIFFYLLVYNFHIKFILQSPNQKIPDRKTKCVIETHLNIKQNVIFDANLKPV